MKKNRLHLFTTRRVVKSTKRTVAQCRLSGFRKHHLDALIRIRALSLTAILCFICNNLYAQWSFTTNAGTITITSYNGTNQYVAIPSAINGYPVTSIKYFLTQFTYNYPQTIYIPSSITNIVDGAFSFCGGITNFSVDSGNICYANDANGVLYDKSFSTLIKCPGGISGVFTTPGNINIGPDAFVFCHNLNSVIISNGPTSLVETFEFCGALTNISLPETISVIGDNVFTSCTSLTRLVIPNNITIIGGYAFASAGLTNLVIPPKVNTISNLAFCNLKGLNRLYFSGNCPNSGTNLFFGDGAVTVYYLPNTTGWSSTYGGMSAVLYNPTITNSSQTLPEYTNITLYASVSDTGIVTYQWLCNSIPISGATNQTLALTNIQFSNAGSYQVIVTNAYGTTITQPVNLAVTKASASILISNLQCPYDGLPKYATVCTSPSNLNTTILYNGTTNAPTVGGVYTVVAAINDPNYYGSITNTMYIGVPSIVQQPTSYLWVSGAELNLTAFATNNTSVYYQWYFNGAQISNATSPSLYFSSLNTNNCGVYVCKAWGVLDGQTNLIYGTNQSINVAISLPGLTITNPAFVPNNSPQITFDGLNPVSGIILRGERTLVSMSTTYPGGSIYYTTDGSVPVPGANGIAYTAPFYVLDSCAINAVAYDQYFANSATAPQITLQMRPLYLANSICNGGGASVITTSPYLGNLYVSNTLIQATATASNGWSLLYWNGTPDLTTNTSTRVVAPTTIGPVFGTPYTVITGGAGVGTVNITPNNANYPYGSTVKLLAQPQTGSYFYRWAPSSQTTNPLYVTINNPSLTNSAVFSPLLSHYYSLIADTSGNGQVTVSPLQGQYTNEATATLTATPGSQYVFSKWTGSVTSTVNPLLITFNTNMYVKGLFIPNVQVQMNPVSKNVVAGTVATFAVGATGPAPLAYQWQLNGANIPGATNFLFNVMSSTYSNAGNYRVIVSNGGINVTSQVASLTVSPPGTLVAWGNSPSGAPSPLTNASAIAPGAAFTLSLQNDTTVQGWGDNSEGQISIPYGLANIIGVSAGLDHSVALRNDGKLIAWGRNNYGQINVPLGLNPVVQLASGIQYTLALDEYGNISAWGRGDNSQTNVPSNLTNVVSIAAGDAFGLALQANGNVVGWGNNSYGQINIPNSVTNAIAIAAGSSHALALLNNGNVVGWGNNSEGQTNIPTGLSNVVSIVAGSAHSMALTQNRTITAWGRNNYGQLTYPPSLNKVAVINAATNYSMAIQSVPPVNLGLIKAGTNIQLSWPSPAGAYSIYSATSLVNSSWQIVTNTIYINGASATISMPKTNKQAYYKLIAQ